MKMFQLTPFQRRHDGFVDLFQDMEKMLENFNRGVVAASDLRGDVISPRMDVAETKDAYEIAADLPGLTEKDIDVQVEGKVLTISGKKEENHEQDGKTWHVRERSSGSFVRSMTLPHAIEADRVQATFRNGVLHLHLPKPEAARVEVKKIEVRS